VDEEKEFGGITEEEDGTVIHPIPVALLSVELDGETTGSRAESAEPFSPPTVEKPFV
jgi:hypothetical protein